MWKLTRSNFGSLLFFGAILVLLIGILLPAMGGPYDIRLDTGQLRERGLLGRVFRDYSLSPEQRKLQTFAQSCGVPSEWAPITVYAPSDGGRSVARQYQRLVPWIDEEPGLARLILLEYVTYIRDMRSRDGWPRSTWFLHAVDANEMTIDLSRLGDPEGVRAGLSEMSYTPRPGGLLDEYLKAPQSAAPSPARSGP